MENGFCAFSGHREVPADAAEQLRRLLREKVSQLASEGVTGFLCGGAMGFDTLAAEAVLTERIRIPRLTLTLALPCPEQSDRWPLSARQKYAAILEEADEVIYISDVYTRFCMMQRNRFLVDHSSRLICYLLSDRGGTAATVRYALQQGVPVENLAMELE